MTEPDHATDPDAARDLARGLADELRAIAELMNTRAAGPDAVAGALDRAREVRATLAGAPPLPRWYEVHEHGGGGREASRAFHDEQGPLRGRANVIAPPLRLTPATRPDGTAVLQGTARLGRRYEGPPRVVHGGILAALFDELLGCAQSLARIRAMTVELTIRYRRPTPIDEELAFEAWIDSDRGRSVTLAATCHARGQLVAEAHGQFVRVDFDAISLQLRDQADDTDAAAVPDATA